MKFILLLSFVLGASCIPLKDAPCTTDIVFVVDTSDSICSSVHINQKCVYWDNMITFLDRFIQNFTVSWTETRMSIVHFSGIDDTDVLFNLNKYFSNWGVKNAIDTKFNYWDSPGDTNTGGALKLVDEQVLIPANGDRSGNANVVFLFTDGNWDVGPHPIEYADKLWARGDTVIYAIGIGGDVSADKMLELTRNQSNIYHVKDYLSLDNRHLMDELVNVADTCHQNTDQCAAKPCLNNGSCTNVGSYFTCECTAGFEGYNCGKVMPCYVNPCQHGGTCREGEYGFSCSCSPQWTGKECSIENPCYYNTCPTAGPNTGTPPNYGHCIGSGVIDCTALSDGNYNTIGVCQQSFTQCAAGRQYNQKCAGELFYDCRIDACVYKKDDPDCH